MERQTIEKIEELALSAANPIIEIPGTTNYYLRQKDGALEFQRLELEPITKVTCGDLATLMTLMDNAKELQLTNLQVFISSDKIVGVAEDKVNERRFVYTLPLKAHPVINVLYQHLKTQDYNKKKFETFLRAQLAGAINPDIVLMARDIKINTQAETEHKNAGGGNATMKASVIAQVESNGKKLPESFVVTAPFYDIEESRGFKQNIEVLLETETSGTDVVFSVTTIHDSFEEAKLETLRHFKQLLEISEYPVYLGSF